MPRARPGRRPTRQDAVREALTSAGRFLSARELHAQMHQDGQRISLSTVYRHLNAFVEDGRAKSVHDHTEQLFGTCESGGHQHHLICESCGSAVELGPPDEDWITRAAIRNGYTITRQLLEVFGRCSACQHA